MKALVYTKAQQLEYRDVDAPIAKNDEVIVRISHVGICGSDMHAFLGHDERRPAPLILGHEAVGTIVGGNRDGERVAINPLATCGRCEACIAGAENVCSSRKIISMPPAEGAFAEMVTIPERNVITIPEHVPMKHAVLTEPIACGWHAVRLGREAMKTTDTHLRTLVLGGGAVGLGCALSLQAHGFSDITVVEPSAVRRALIQSFDLQACAPDALSTDIAFDMVFDNAGFEATRAQASQMVKPKGVIVHVGLGSAMGGLDIRRLTLQEITFIGSYTYSNTDFRETAEAIFAGRFASLDWTEEMPLSQGQSAFMLLKNGQAQVPKIVLTP